MDSAVVVGNCQAPGLELLLLTNEAFAKRFRFRTFPAVHEIPDAQVGELHQAVAQAKVVVVQRVAEDYRDGIGLGTETIARLAANATVIRWPSVYWAGYVPDLFYLRDSAGRPVVDGPFDYHDRLILECFASGRDPLRACEALADPERPSRAPAWAEQATAELALRGEDCDVSVTPLISSRFRAQLLFLTMNHPANAVLAFIAQQVIDLLGLPGGVHLAAYPHELLGSTFYPLHANDARALELEFDGGYVAGDAPFKIRGATYQPVDAVSAFYEYYMAHPELVAVNSGEPR